MIGNLYMALIHLGDEHVKLSIPDLISRTTWFPEGATQ